MINRITPQHIAGQAIFQANTQSASLQRIQQQITTGVKLLRPSDDPVAASLVSKDKSLLSRLEVFSTNLTRARSTLNQSVSSLLEVQNALVRAKQIGLEGVQSINSNDPHHRNALAGELNSLIDQLFSLANSQSEGRFLFGGSVSVQEPYQVLQQSTVGLERVVYSGGSLPLTAGVGPGYTAELLNPGENIFPTGERLPTLFLGKTGAQPGVGTDSMTGQVALLVRHTATSYAPGSGVQPGASSVDGDTVIGPAGAHTLTLTVSGDGSSGTASLNGAPAVNFLSSDTDLEVTGSKGESVFLDFSSMVPSFSGTIDITADGVLSIDQGVTETPIDFSTNQVLTDTPTGRVLHVDSSQIRIAGEEPVEFQGTHNVFETLIALRDDLLGRRGLDNPTTTEALGRRLNGIDDHFDQVLSAVGDFSVALESLDFVEERMRNAELEGVTRISELESADLGELAVRLASDQNQLQATFAVTSRLLGLSFLDFIV